MAGTETFASALSKHFTGVEGGEGEGEGGYADERDWCPGRRS